MRLQSRFRGRPEHRSAPASPRSPGDRVCGLHPRRSARSGPQRHRLPHCVLANVAPAVVARYEDRMGNPVLFDRRVFPQSWPLSGAIPARVSSSAPSTPAAAGGPGRRTGPTRTSTPKPTTPRSSPRCHLNDALSPRRVQGMSAPASSKAGVVLSASEESRFPRTDAELHRDPSLPHQG